MALVMSVLLLGTVLACASADEYRQPFVEEWSGGDDNDCSRKWWEIGTSNSWHYTSEGKMQLFVTSELGEFWAWSKIRRDFDYDHSHDGINWISASFVLRGYLSPGGDSYVWFRAHLHDVTPGYVHKMDTREIWQGDCHFALWDKPYWNGRYSFQANLTAGHSYSVTFQIYSKVEAIGLFTVIDFRNVPQPGWAERCVDMKRMDIYHTDHSITTWGGDTTGVLVEGEYSFEQDSCNVADTLYYRPFVRDSYIKGWKIRTSTFLASECDPDGDMALKVKAYDADIARNEIVDVDIKIWLDSKNSMGVDSISWHPKDEGARSTAQAVKTVPGHFWRFDDGYVEHPFTMINPDPVDSLRVNALQFLPSLNHVEHISSLDFDSLAYNFKLGPGDSFKTTVSTPPDFVGSHIYFRYDLLNAAGDRTACNAWGGHEVTERQGTMEGDPALESGFSVDSFTVTRGVPNVFNITPANYAHTSMSCTGQDTFGVFVFDTEGWTITGNPPLGQCHILDPAETWSQDIIVTPPFQLDYGDTDTVIVMVAYGNIDGIIVPEIGDCEDPNWNGGSPCYSADTLVLGLPVGTDVPETPAANYLSQNYPNPFNPATKICYGLAGRSHVSLRIYDVSGRLLRVLVDAPRQAGHHEETWDGRDSGGRIVASGVYFYELIAGEFRESKKMVMLR